MFRIYENNIYNQEIKDMFLLHYPERTRTTYMRIFHIASKTEMLLKKDLYDFNIDEIKQVIYDSSPLTYRSAQSTISIISTYIDWAIIEGLRGNRINPANNIDDYNKFLVKISTHERFLTESELEKFENKELENAQDAVILRLLFEGVSGKNWNEIRNLKKEDIIKAEKNNNVLVLYDEREERSLQVSQKCIDLCKEAIEEERYKKKNAQMETEYEHITKELDLIENEYVVRPANTRVLNPNAPIGSHIIRTRVSVIRELFGLPYLTPKNIIISGVLSQANKIMQEKEELNAQDYKKIAERYKYDNHYIIKDYIERYYNDVCIE